MTQPRWFMTSLFSLFCILTFVTDGRATVTDPLTTINLNNPVYFLAPDGDPRVVPADTYTVETADEWLRLNPGERHDAVLIEAKKGTHELYLTEPLALSVPGVEDNNQDIHHVILLLPNGQSLEATGSYSGIRPRGLFDQAVNNVKKQTNQAYKKAKSTAKKAVSQAKSTAGQATKQARQQTQKAVSQAKKGAQNVQKQARKGTQQAISKAKKGAQNVGKQVQKGTQQAVATARQGTQAARNAALQAKRQVEKRARQTAGRIQSGVQAGMNQLQNNPLVATLQSEIQTLEAVRKLSLEPLFSCLAHSSGKGKVNFPQMIQQFSNNPPAFANQLFQNLMQEWEQNFSDIMAEQLQLIRNPSRSLPQGPQVIAMAFRSMEKLAEKGPGGRCLMQFVRPHLKTFKNTSGQLQRTTQTQAQRIFDNQVAPIVFGSLSKEIGKLMTEVISLTPQDIARMKIHSRGIEQPHASLDHNDMLDGQISSRGVNKEDDKESLLGNLVPGFGDIIDIKNSVLADQLLNPRNLYSASSKIDLLIKSLNNPAQRSQTLNEVRTALDPNAPWTESLYIDIGMEILRVVGKNYLNSEAPGGGSFIIRSGVEVLDFGEQTVGTVVNSAAGLVPEVGGIVAGLVKVTPDAIWKLTINNIIVGSVKGGAHFAYGKVIDKAKDALKTGRPFATIQQHAGPLSTLLQYLPSKQQILLLASTHTEDTRKALEQYNRSVIRLAETAAQ